MDILTQARENYRAASRQSDDLKSNLPANSNRWSLFQEDMRRLIEAHTTVAQAVQHAQTCGFDHRGPIAGNEKKILLCRHCLIYEYPQFAAAIDKFSDSKVSIPSTMAVLDEGPLISDMLYFHISYILAALSYRSDFDTVCEIGGGYGGPARLWLTNPIRPLRNYTIVDLPESLFYAEVFLRAACPDHKIVYCREPRDFTNTAERTIYLVPIHLAKLTCTMQFDLITNTGSLAELSDEWVHFWSRWVDTQRCNLFYSHNYFGIPVGKLFESRNIVAPITPAGWRVGSLRTNPPLMLLQSSERNVLEVFLFRSGLSANKRWPYDAMKLQQPEKMSLRDFAYGLLNLPPLEEIDVAAELSFLDRAVADLHFLPKELIHLVDRITSAKTFGELSAGDQERVQTVSQQLKATYDANYPQGRHAN